MFKEFDVVRTIIDKKVPKGSVGTIVSVYSSGAACEVEFLDDKGMTIAVETYEFLEIELLERD